MTSMEQWQTTAASYAVLGAVCYSAWYYYNKGNNRQGAQVQRNTTPRQLDSPHKPENKSSRGKQREEKQKAGSRKPKQSETHQPTYTASADNTEQDNEKDSDRAFAESLRKTQKGTTFASSKDSKPRIKSVKPSTGNKTPELSASSSTTGPEADEEASSGHTVPLGATDAETAPIAFEDDMGVEKPKNHASITITPSNKPERQAQPKKQSSSLEVETKKQRQNRKKAEEARLAREEIEGVRRQAMEKQRREARIAEGRAAKDGTASGTASYKPTSNAWTSSAAPAVQAPTEDAPLLDTMNTNTNGSSADKLTKNLSGMSGANGVPGNSGSQTNGTATSAKANYENLPSEEEQMRILKEQDDNWTTVAKPKKGKKKQNGIAGGSESGDAAEVA